jgi:hypothetical protein
VVPKPKRMSPAEHMAITTLLVDKDKNLQAALKASYEALGKFLAIKCKFLSRFLQLNRCCGALGKFLEISGCCGTVGKFLIKCNLLASFLQLNICCGALGKFPSIK